MAFSLDYKMIFLLESIVLHACMFTTTHATLLEQECDKARDPEFCLNVFGSDPATRNASSLVSLAQIGIDKATSLAAKTRADINERLFFSTQPNESNVLSECLHEYNGALAALKIAPVYLRRLLYDDLYLRGSQAQTAAARCEQTYINNKLPSLFTRANVQLVDFCDIIKVVANDLSEAHLFLHSGEDAVLCILEKRSCFTIRSKESFAEYADQGSYKSVKLGEARTRVTSWCSMEAEEMVITNISPLMDGDIILPLPSSSTGFNRTVSFQAWC